MFNRQAIMSNAWSQYRKAMGNKYTAQRTGITTFADALRKAWATAKAEMVTTPASKLGWVSAKSLSAGDIVRVSLPGCASIFTNKTVASVEANPLGWAGVCVKFTDGSNSSFISHTAVEKVA